LTFQAVRLDNPWARNPHYRKHGGIVKKGWLIGCGIAGILGVVVCAGVGYLIYQGVALAFTLTQPVVDASDTFLGLVGQGKTAEAYAATASGFRAQHDEASFTAAAKQVGLTDYASVSWNTRNRTNDEGNVAGTVTTKQGGTTPIAIQLVNEGGSWRVVTVRYGGVELADVMKSVAQKAVPADEELRRLATETLLDFNQAVKAGDFTAFHGKVSAPLQQKFTAQQLQDSFQEFIDKKIDIDGIKDVAPQLDAPAAINNAGVLTVKGHYPTRPNQVRFALEYVREAAGWKLLSINVKVGE
jgi:FlaG/FlaF family flagellin (archaellin)